VVLYFIIKNLKKLTKARTKIDSRFKVLIEEFKPDSKWALAFYPIKLSVMIAYTLILLTLYTRPYV